MSVAVLVLFLLHLTTPGYSWQCENGYCSREIPDGKVRGYSTMELCQLMCTNYLNLWPHPTGKFSSLKNLVYVNPGKIVFQFNGDPTTIPFLQELANYFKDKLNLEEPFNCHKDLNDVDILLNPSSGDTTLVLGTDESYTLNVDMTGEQRLVNISAPTVFGVRHGLETLLQLLVTDTQDDQKCLVTLSDIHISDSPKYKHRALLIDSARNYLSVETIKKQMDAMASSKLNVLHWHLTDSQSFPLVSPRLPNMTLYGAYSRTNIYTPSVVGDLVQYARIRGIRLLIEIDGPSHAGMGWQWGAEADLGNLAVCVNKQPWRSFCIQPPCGQLNPANPILYLILTDLYKDISEMVPDMGMFHMGGDEVFIPCWNSTQEIVEYLKGKPLTKETFLDLWGEFQARALEAFDSAVGHKDTKIVLWTSQLTQPEVITKYLSKERYIIHTWVPEEQNDIITKLLELGYQVIISTKDKWYLDHGFNLHTTYHHWKTVYENEVYPYSNEAILGGEVCMWGEQVDDYNIDSKTWPRSAAAAERLWSNPRSSAVNAQARFFAHRARLIKRGIRADAVMPLWCIQNQGECNSYT